MVMLRRSSSVTEPLKGDFDMDTSTEFLSLRRAQKKSARLQKGLTDSYSSTENSPTNGYLSAKEKGSMERGGMKTRAKTDKHAVSFADASNKPSSSPPKDEKSMKRLRKSPRLQKDEKSGDEINVEDEIDGAAASKNLRARLRERKVDCTVRRSSRITRYKFNARDQSVLYDRLITNTAEAVLQKMDDMQKMRRRLGSRDSKKEDLRMYSGSKRKRTTKSSQRTDEESADEQENGHDEYTDQEDGNEDGEGTAEEEEEDNDEGDDDDDEEEEDNQKRYEFRQRKAVVRYQAPLEEPRKQSIFFRRHSTPTRRRYSFSATGPCSPYNRRRSSRSPLLSSFFLSTFMFSRLGMM